MDKQKIAEKIRSVIEPTISDMGYKLIDIVFEKEEAYNGRDAMVVVINKEGGILIEDCIKVHKAINPLVDEVNPINMSYILEVSSPGAEVSDDEVKNI